jgi:hypothetical protein
MRRGVELVEGLGVADDCYLAMRSEARASPKMSRSSSPGVERVALPHMIQR